MLVQSIHFFMLVQSIHFFMYGAYALEYQSQVQ